MSTEKIDRGDRRTGNSRTRGRVSAGGVGTARSGASATAAAKEELTAAARRTYASATAGSTASAAAVHPQVAEANSALRYWKRKAEGLQNELVEVRRDADELLVRESKVGARYTSLRAVNDKLYERHTGLAETHKQTCEQFDAYKKRSDEEQDRLKKGLEGGIW